MKKIILYTFMFAAVASCTKKENPDEQWIELFNGKDLSDWIVKIHHHDPGVNAGNTFRVIDGMISVRYDEYGDFNDQFGHLYYKTPFENFHLSLDYHFTGKLHPSAPYYTILNSGVMFHAQDPLTIKKEQNWPISVEMQFLARADSNDRPTGNMCSPGTDIVFEGGVYPDHCLNSTSKTFPPDAWVHADLVVYNDSLILHIIEGDTVLRYSKPTMGGGVVAGHDSALWKPGAPLRSGYIALQSEGQPIDFRNLKLRKLVP